MGIAGIDLAMMADRVRGLRADVRRDQISRSARQAYTAHSTPRTTADHGAAAARALRGFIQASLSRTDR